MSPNHHYQPHHRSPCSNSQHLARGFTLVEVMVAALIMVIALLGLLGSTVRAYQIGADTRYRDQARGILQSLCSEFLRLPRSNAFFTTTAAPTGNNLMWTQATPLADGSGLEVPLGADPSGPQDLTHPVATITSHIQEINPANGSVGVGAASSSSDKILVGTFTARYTVNRRETTIRITVARATCD